MLIEWQVRSAVFSNNTISYCRGDLELATLQESWSKLMLHWAAQNGFPYQAVADNNLEFDLYFWPDKRNMLEQHLSARVASETPLAVEDMGLVVAAEKGLPALEWLTFNETLSTEQRCTSLPAVASYYSDQVDSIVQYHENHPVIQSEWIEPRNSTEGASISLNLSFQQIGQLSNRLRNGLDEQGQFIPILSEGSRSNLGKAIYEASYASIIQHLRLTLERLDVTVNSQGLLAMQIDHMAQLAARLTDLAEVDPNLMLEIHTSLIDAEQLIEGPLAQDAGVLIGFNNYDGD